MDRTVSVRLSLQAQGFMQGVEAARKKTAEFGSEAEKLAQKRESFTRLGAGMLAVGAAAGVGIGVAVKKFADFEQSMSNVAATGDDARSSMDALRQAALDAGASTVFSATESANAIEELAKAGVDADDILSGGLKGSLDLAAAGGLGVADAAGIAATALKTFNLEGSDMSHVADLLAAGAGKAMGDVTDLSAALAQGGQVAAATGLSIEETTAGLAAFASQGLLGSDAGTSFKTMLQRLTPQSKAAKDQFDALGISAYDANGQFVGLADFAGQLQTAMKDLTPEARNAAMSVMFGSDAVRASNVLYSEGEAGIRKWITAVDDQGYAAETAATRLDNLKGDWEALTGAVDSALISMGSAANGPLRTFVQGLTGMVDTFNALPGGVQQGVLGVGALGAAAALAGGLFFTAIPKIAEYNAALADMGPNAQRAGRAVTALGKGAGIVAAAGTALAVGITAAIEYADKIRGTDEAIAKATTTNISFVESMENLRTGVSSVTDVKRALDDMASGNVWGEAGTNIQAVADGLTKLDRGFDGLPLEDAVSKFQAWGDELNLSDAQMATMLDKLPTLRDAIQENLKASGEAADGQAVLKYAMAEASSGVDQQSAALDALSGKATSTGDEVDNLADTIRGFGSAVLDTREANRSFEAAFDDLTESIKTNGKSLSAGTEKGRANQAALDDAAKSVLDLAASTYTQTGSQEKANKVLATGRDRLIDMLGQFGITGERAERYADKLGLIPENVNSAVKMIGYGEALRKVNDVASAIRNIPGYKESIINQVVKKTGAARGEVAAAYNAQGGMYSHGVKEFAVGGFASGIYPGQPGGIHKFAEGHLPWETYISPDPAYRERNLDIWAETGRRLGAYQPAPSPIVVMAEPQGSRGNGIVVDQTGATFYSYDPTSVAKETKLQLGRALDAAGLSGTY